MLVAELDLEGEHVIEVLVEPDFADDRRQFTCRRARRGPSLRVGGGRKHQQGAHQ
jgi:hypothetical protein